SMPKPIYSYSILIFMALKNSKTGSLPVSEIYNFMTEHFPYFKTAPDGWKNSVRHNLSLNKCFEKVENKSGSSSRKGCLWALNPAKIDKMQEELQKWKRK
uniref:Forkhead box protein N1 n=1 Tax=Homo sapiens TaxID=9606 RepID=UPI000B8BB305|nr:Chain A, Forkhead box protein N1 [Homo sapiens]5OCN_B Chain B, Forkhead box protein N1 [Homo sapiens]5OCN_C Chain C, Forkhead box protein N1 [Homo sapiens]5OCN_D Chain D, Forkhead box protein N1 [Homo sapiens]5OCN_E Chain E, Forkhead box protein N1 [Homo sapiens]5OCN_F Chain F, Forkhead box protein N1 [Homo sapiens]5OCN_G Chain G, Forkhead box protein N1 [Homo sapiens]5OCN_H Chain H, Forkhead box protein N1 [Homo sapiens]6EL8_A Chain A, Forkhead box protein N1 [Homo sapiens]6EL8_D Chain